MLKKLLTLLFFCFPVAVLGATVIGSISTTTGSTPTIVDVTNHHFPMTVSMIPESGVTGTVEYSTTPDAAGSASAVANWHILDNLSASSVSASVTMPSPVTAVRFIRNSGASSVIGEIDWTN